MKQHNLLVYVILYELAWMETNVNQTTLYSDNIVVVRMELHVNNKKIITDNQSSFAFA